MFPSTDVSWPSAVLTLGLLFLGILFIGLLVASYLEWRKTRMTADQEESLRQLVGRYEQLAENTMDAQKRIAADVSELRSRATAIEQILRTVE